MSDLSEVLSDVHSLLWLDRAACAELEIPDFFVAAGHVIDDVTLNICRGCPVRLECVRHAYKHKIIGGYFGGLSPGQRREMSIDEAEVFINADPPRESRDDCDRPERVREVTAGS